MLLATAADTRERADVGPVLRQQVFAAGCGIPVDENAIFSADGRAEYIGCRRGLGMARTTAAAVDSQVVLSLLDQAWRSKLAAILHRQTRGSAAGDPEEQLRRYLETPPAESLSARARTLGLPVQGLDVYIQVFKREARLEVHARRHGTGDPYRFLKGFDITASPFTYPDSAAWRRPSSPLRLAGPKTRQGDGRVPEGCYQLVHANRWSHYHLSFAVTYPNGADLARRARWGVRSPTGGSIALHGGQESVGCIAMGDAAMEEIYLFLDANGADERGGFARIDIFPCRFGKGESDETLAYYARHRQELKPLWASLRALQEHFTRTRQVPKIAWDRAGSYKVARP